MGDATSSAPSPSERDRPARRVLALGVSWLFAAVLITGVAAVGVAVSRPPENADALTRLVPLSVGTTWVYRTTTNGKDSGLHTTEVTSPALLSEGPGLQNAVVVRSHFENFLGQGTPFTQLAYEGRSGSRLVLYGRRTGGKFDPTTPPMPLYSMPLAKGTKWSWSGTDSGSTSK